MLGYHEAHQAGIVSIDGPCPVDSSQSVGNIMSKVVELHPAKVRNIDPPKVNVMDFIQSREIGDVLLMCACGSHAFGIQIYANSPSVGVCMSCNKEYQL